MGHVAYSEEQRKQAEPGRRRPNQASGLIRLELSFPSADGHRKVQGLLDCGAEGNFIDAVLAKELGLEVDRRQGGRYEALNGQSLAILGQAAATYLVTDSLGTQRGCKDAFEVGGIHGFPVVLGMPWLERWNPSVNFETKHTAWRKKRSQYRRVAAVRADQFAKEVVGTTSLLYALSVQALSGKTAQDGPPAPYGRWSSVFSEENAAKLPEHGPFDLSIELEEGKRPSFAPLYNLSETELAVLRKYLDEYIAKGWVRPSKSPAGANILFAKKKDGSLRLCVDYRSLNAMTVKNRLPLPLIQESLDRLGSARIYTKLDVRDAYHKLRIKEGDEWKTAFRTRYGLFEYTVVPFGLTNAPAAFQGYINHALADLIDVCCVVYLDDILVYSDTEEEHIKHVQEVLERLQRYKLYVKLSKCEWHVSQVEYLGYIVAPEGVKMDPERARVVEEWPEPRSIRDIRIFVGFANYYRRFIRRFSRLAAPLNRMTEKVVGDAIGGARQRREESQEVKLTQEAREAFLALKRAFVTAPILRHFDPARAIRVETDASGFAISGVLSQQHEFEGKMQWYPVAYFSRKMTPAERNYDTHDGELLALVESFKTWRQYVEGARHQINWLTDHNNLQWFMITKTLSRRQVRWAELLSTVDFRTTHKPGVQNGAADAASRRPDYMDQDHSGRWVSEGESAPLLVLLQGQLDPTTPEKAIKGRVAVARARQHTEAANGYTLSTARGLHDDIRRAQGTDRMIERVAGEKAAGLGEAWLQRWEVGGDVALFEGKMYVPEGSLRIEALQQAHDDPLAGHFGFKRTKELLQRVYWWPGARAYVKDYVASCKTCERNKPRRHKPYGLLHAEDPPYGPWEALTLDFVTDLPPSALGGRIYDSILVIVDRFTKMAHYVPCRKDMDAEGLGEVFLREVVRLHGVPKSIVSDRGPILTAKFWSTLCYYLGIRRGLSTAFHPQTDGQTERQNQTMEQYLRSYCNFEQDDWAPLLSMAEFAYNDSENASTGSTPFILNYVRDPRTAKWPELALQGSSSARAEELADRVISLQRTLRSRLQKAKLDQAKYYDRGRKAQKYNVGDMVYLSTRYLKTPRASKKLDQKYIGPFEVKRVVNDAAYTLELPSTMNVHPTFHVSLLEGATEAKMAQRDQMEVQPQVLADEEDPEVWEVEEVRGQMRGDDGTWYYRVVWKGYPGEDTWEPAVHLSPSTLRAYQQRVGQIGPERSTDDPPVPKRRRGRPKKGGKIQKRS